MCDLKLHADVGHKKMKTHTFINESLVCEDIERWLIEYIEIDHKFYNYKFPPCPYAKSARLQGMVVIKAYDGTGFKNFINTAVTQLTTDSTKSVCILAFPSYFKWNFFVKWFVGSLNKTLIPCDYYAQFGTALKTNSKYPGILNGKPYFIVIINQLSSILDGHNSLLKTDYYKPWAKHHYRDVVLRREQAYKKFSQHNKHF
jgi:hypothetical protein